MGTLSPLRDQVWDTAWLLDERTSFGQAVNFLTGYESAPSLTLVLIFGA